MEILRIVLAAAILLFGGGAGADTITLVADEWCPFNCEPGSDEPGYVIEIARKVFGEAGHSLSYEVLPWKRAVIMTRQGKYNGVIGAVREEAEDFIFPKEEIDRASTDFFVRKGDPWRFDGVDSLKKVRLGAILDYSYAAVLDEYIANNRNKVDLATGDDAIDRNLKKLVHGRIDVMLEQEVVVRYAAKRLGFSDKIEFAGNDNVYDPLYVAFSPADPKSPQYAAIFDKGIRKLRDSGELAKILARYGLTDWKVEQANLGKTEKPSIQHN